MIWYRAILNPYNYLEQLRPRHTPILPLHPRQWGRLLLPKAARALEQYWLYPVEVVLRPRLQSLKRIYLVFLKWNKFNCASRHVMRIRNVHVDKIVSRSTFWHTATSDPPRNNQISDLPRLNYFPCEEHQFSVPVAVSGFILRLYLMWSPTLSVQIQFKVLVLCQ